MVVVKREGIILKSTSQEFENLAVMNPGCVQEGNAVHMFYRAVREGNYSSIGYCRLDGPLEVVERSKEPVLSPEFDYEKHGIEDPRVVCIDGTYYLTYMAYDGKNVGTGYATSRDLKNFRKRGVFEAGISYAEATKLFRESDMPERYFCFEKYDKIEGDTEDSVLLWGKDSFLFPKKINGKFALVRRVIPDIQVVYFDDFHELTLQFQREYLSHLSDYIALEAKHWFESWYIGGGCPPIETRDGWLFIYHAIEDGMEGKVYRAGAALLDRKNPCKTIGRLKEPLFSPEEEWEKKGDVNNVVFPTGTAIFDGRLYIYYGAADSRIAIASLNMDELVENLLEGG